MSKIALEPNAAGTGTFTIAAPSSNTNRTLTLPDETGTVLTNGSAIPAAQIAGALNATGSAPMYACRAWVNFNGTGTVTIRASGNVSSITDRGTGRYDVNFATAMPDGNYSAVADCRKADVNDDANMNLTLGSTSTTYNSNTVALTTTYSNNLSSVDPDIVTCAVFR